MRTGVTFGALALRPDGGGVSTYIRNLVAALADSGLPGPLAAVVQHDAAHELAPGVQALCRARSSGVRRALDGLRSSPPSRIFHGLDIDLPLRPTAATVSTVHDLSVFDVPWADGALRVRGERLLIRKAMSKADAIVAVSPFTASRVEALFGRIPVVTPLAPDPIMRPPTVEEVDRVRSHYRLPETFVLQVGSIEPRKDVTTLASACAAVRSPLVLAGSVMRGSEAPTGARTLGFVPRADLPALYGAATVVAYLSIYEGFGLPPVEAMACGAAVVSTRVASLGEVLGDGAELVPVGDVDAVAHILKELLADEDRRRELQARALARAGTMTWAATAAATTAVYADL